jgi:hypothetical protein
MKSTNLVVCGNVRKLIAGLVQLTTLKALTVFKMNFRLHERMIDWEAPGDEMDGFGPKLTFVILHLLEVGDSHQFVAMGRQR